MPFSHSQQPTDRRHARRLATRASILEAAERVVLTEGYPALTTKKLVEEAGVSERTIFNHFENLENVVLSRVGDLLTEMFEGHSIPQDAPLSELPDIIDNFYREHISSEYGADKLTNFANLALSLGALEDGKHEAIGFAVIKALNGLADNVVRQIEEFYPSLPSDHKMMLSLYTFNLSTSVALGMGKALFTRLDPIPESEREAYLAELSVHETIDSLRAGIIWAFDQVNAGKPAL